MPKPKKARASKTKPAKSAGAASITDGEGAETEKLTAVAASTSDGEIEGTEKLTAAAAASTTEGEDAGTEKLTAAAAASTTDGEDAGTDKLSGAAAGDHGGEKIEIKQKDSPKKKAKFKKTIPNWANVSEGVKKARVSASSIGGKLF